MSNPTVSVILPVYNGEHYVRLAIDSVLGQTLEDFELIVIDDGSADSTAEIVRSYGERVNYVRQENSGVAGAFNHGLRLAQGRYISWLSHDDVFLPAKLATQVEALGQVAIPAACYTDTQIIDGVGALVIEHRLPEFDRHKVLRHVLTGGPICSASYSVMYDRRCIEEVGPYSEFWRYTQDVDMLAKLAARFPLIHVPEILMQVREHETRGIHSKAWEREVCRFFQVRLNSLQFQELFPDLGERATKPERSAAYRWLADALAAQPYPISWAAFSQYRRALREHPADAALLMRRIAGLYWRHIRRSVNPA
jgi:glycosyltransferase involved in cell wall biosynthesis